MERSYVVLSPELAGLLSKAKVDLQGEIEAALKADGLEATTELGGNPLSTEPDRDVVLVILATAALVSVVGNVVTRVIRTLAQKDLKFVDRTVAVDDSGRAIRDREGNPVFNVKEAPGAEPAPAESGKTRIKVANLFEFELSSGGRRNG